MILNYEIFYLILIIVLLFRIIFQIVFKIDTIDSYYNLTAAKQIWNEKKIPKSLNSFLLNGTYSYPPILHFIIAPFVGKHKIFPIKFIGIFFDFLSILAIYFIIGEIFDYKIALISTLIYSVTPINIFESFSITPRPIGWFFLNAFLLISFFSIFYDSLFLIFPASISIVGILLSHKMATQSLILVSIPIITIYFFIDHETSFFIITSLILGIILTIFISKGFYKKIFYGHISILKYHLHRGNYDGIKKFGNPIQILQRIPWLILFPILFYSNLENFQPQNLFLIIWSTSFLLLSILWKFGDNYRYLVYGIIPLSVIFSQVLLNLESNIFLLTFSAILVLCTTRLILFFKNQRNRKLIHPNLISCFEYVNELNDIKRISIVPFTLVYPAAFYTNKKILGSDPSPEVWKNANDYTQIVKNSFLLNHVLKEYDVFTFILDTEDKNALSLKSELTNSETLKSIILYKKGSFEVIKVVSIDSKKEFNDS